LLAPPPISKLEDHTLFDVRDYLFHMFAATLHNRDRFSIGNLSTRHAVVREDSLIMDQTSYS